MARREPAMHAGRADPAGRRRRAPARIAAALAAAVAALAAAGALGPSTAQLPQVPQRPPVPKLPQVAELSQVPKLSQVPEPSRVPQFPQASRLPQAARPAVPARPDARPRMPGAADVAGLDSLPLPPGTLRTDLGAGMSVAGMPLRIQVFDAPAPLAATLRTLLSGVVRGAAGSASGMAGSPGDPGSPGNPGSPGDAGSPGDPRLLTLPDAVLLYWDGGEGQWLARLSASGPERTRGTLSLLAQGAVPATPSAMPSSYPDWAPPGLHRQFELADGAHAPSVRHGVYTHAEPPPRLAARLQAALRRAGWRGEDWNGDGWHGGPRPWRSGYRRWSRGARSLSLLLAPLAAGSGLFVLESGK